MIRLKGRLREAMVFLCIAGGWAGWWAWSELRLSRTVAVPEGGTNLAAFLRARPEIGGIKRLSRNGLEYFAVVGRVNPPGFSLPSGPPVYVFDHSGQLADWTPDIGDADSFRRRWGRVETWKDVTPSEALRIAGNQ